MGSTFCKGIIGAAALAVTIGVTNEAHAAPETHDGFFLRFEPGFGYLHSKATFLGTSQKVSGITFTNSLLLGGTLFDGFVLGGGFRSDYAFSPDIETGGVSGNLDWAMLFSILGFVEYYPDPQGGLHFHASFGWGGLETKFAGANVGGSDPTGLVTAFGAGYGWFLGDEWSVGVMARLGYAPLELNDNRFNTLTPAVVATFTYH